MTNSRSANGTTDLAGTVRHDIETTLQSRHAEAGSVSAGVEDSTKRSASRAWSALKRHSYLAVIGIGAVTVVAADAIGVGELVMGLAAAYGTWKVLRHNEAPAKAIDDVVSAIERAG